ncbi:MAG: VOC family protein [Trueperaceae bacterium]
MVNNIFINLPVKDLPASRAFFSKLGFTFNEQFSDDNAACMIIGENMFAMLLKEEYFKTFIHQDISDAKKTTEVLIALGLENREAVAAMVQKAVAAGGNTYNEARDLGFMLQHGFQDLDGHIWEVFFMEPTNLQ